MRWRTNFHIRRYASVSVLTFTGGIGDVVFGHASFIYRPAVVCLSIEFKAVKSNCFNSYYRKSDQKNGRSAIVMIPPADRTAGGNVM